MELLAGLEPEIAATGHGRPLRGPALREGLAELARRFDQLAVPRRGRYVERPAVAGGGDARAGKTPARLVLRVERGAPVVLKGHGLERLVGLARDGHAG